MASLYPLLITATTIEDAWIKCLYLITAEKGDPTFLDPNGELGWQTYAREYSIQKGSFENQDLRREFHDITIHLTNPDGFRSDKTTAQGLLPYIPEGLKEVVQPPADAEYVDIEYLPYLLTDEKKPREEYTYGERWNHPRYRLPANEKGGITVKWEDYEEIEKKGIYDVKIHNKGQEIIIPAPPASGLKRIFELDTDIYPLEKVIEIYRKGYNNTNQATMEIAMPTDIEGRDPPCLRIVDTRMLPNEDGSWSLHFRMYFRSWDLWAGLPPNLAGLQMAKEYLVYRINDGKPESEWIKDGEIIVSSKGLHLYGSTIPGAKIITNRKS